MHISFYNTRDREREVDALLNSFRTEFWLDKHQWFVRCDWTQVQENDFGFTNPYMLLYTLPYFPESFYYSEIIYSKSTCPNDRDYWSYDRVCDLQLENIGFIEYISKYPICFPNLRKICLTSSLLSSLRPFFSILDRLVTLYIMGYDADDQADLQVLLNYTTCLSSLQFNTYCHSQLSLSNSSLRRLYFSYTNAVFSAQQCVEFCRSSLFQQCEVLPITIDTREIILDFLKKMPNLRSLSFICRDDKLMEGGTLNRRRQDELIDWLKDHLPSNCWITRPQFCLIRLWIA